MKMYIYLIIIIIVQPLISIAQCEEYKNENVKLVEEIDKLRNSLDDEKIAYDELNLKFEKEQETRIKYQQLYFREKYLNETLREQISEYSKKIAYLEGEKKKLKETIKTLEKVVENKNYDLMAARMELDNTYERILTLKKDRNSAEDAFFNRKATIEDYKEKIQILEDEAKDKISVRNKKVFFKGKWYKYGEEILFVEFKNLSQNKMELNSKDKYLLERITKLVKKYDFRVRLRLTGESKVDDRSQRIKLAKGRVEKLKSHLVIKHEATSDNFSNTKYIKDKARIGVSITIERK